MPSSYAAPVKFSLKDSFDTPSSSLPKRKGTPSLNEFHMESENTGFSFWGTVKGITRVFFQGIEYAVHHPFEALILGLASQVTPNAALNLHPSSPFSSRFAERAIGDEFIINQITTGIQSAPSVASLLNGNAFVAWQGDQTGSYDIYGRVFFPDGTALSNEFPINQNTTTFQNNTLVLSLASLFNDNVFVAWQGDQTGDTDIYGRVFFPNGTALSDEFPINQNTTNAQERPSVASLLDGNAFVTWDGYQTGDGEIRGRVFFPNGTALSNEFLINQNTTNDRFASSVASLSNGNAFVVWDGQGNFDFDIYGRVFFPNGTALSNEFPISQNAVGFLRTPSVASLPNGNAFVAWGDGEIRGRVFFPNGTALSDEFLFNQNTTSDQGDPSVASLSNGNAFVAWDGYQMGNFDIYGRVFFPNGTALSNEFPINQNTTSFQFFPSVASLPNGNAFVAWRGDQTGNGDIYGRILTSSFFQNFEGSTTRTQTTSSSPASTGSSPAAVGGGIGGAIGGAVGGCTLLVCGVAGCIAVKKLFSKNENEEIDEEQELGETLPHGSSPFAPSPTGFTEHPTFVGTLQGKTYEIWKTLSQEEVNLIHPLTAKPIPPFRSKKVNFDLGRGNFGATYFGMDQKTQKFVAIKVVSGRKAVDESLREGEIMHGLGVHPNLMHLLDYKHFEPSEPSQDPRLFQVMDLAYMNGARFGEMLTAIDNKQREVLVSDTFGQLMTGLDYMHSKGIVHLDIKDDNLLYMRDGTIRIADFGRAQQKGVDDRLTDHLSLGDIRKFSPEILALIRKNIGGEGEKVSSVSGKAADVWAAGLYIWELLEDKEDNLISCQVVPVMKPYAFFRESLKKIDDLTPKVSSFLLDTLRSVLTVDSEKRLTASEAVPLLSPSMMKHKLREAVFTQLIQTSSTAERNKSTSPSAKPVKSAKRDIYQRADSSLYLKAESTLEKNEPVICQTDDPTPYLNAESSSTQTEQLVYFNSSPTGKKRH